jgi:hypothetical protein
MANETRFPVIIHIMSFNLLYFLTCEFFLKVSLRHSFPKTATRYARSRRRGFPRLVCSGKRLRRIGIISAWRVIYMVEQLTFDFYYIHCFRRWVD